MCCPLFVRAGDAIERTAPPRAHRYVRRRVQVYRLGRPQATLQTGDRPGRLLHLRPEGADHLDHPGPDIAMDWSESLAVISLDGLSVAWDSAAGAAASLPPASDRSSATVWGWFVEQRPPVALREPD